MPIEGLVLWGAGTAAGALLKPVLDDLAKDISKDQGKTWLGRAAKRLPRVEALQTFVKALPSGDIEGAYEQALAENAFVKAYGKVVKELVEVIDEELRNAGVAPSNTEAWAKEIQQLVRTDGLISAFDAALTSSSGSGVDGLTLSRGWQQLTEPARLPPDFDWQYVAQTFQRKLRKLRTEDADLRAVLQAQAAAETADNTQRLAGLQPEFNLDGYRESLLEYHGNLKLELLDATGVYHKTRLWSVFVPQTVRNCDGYVPQLLEIPKEVQVKLRAQGEWDDALNRLSEEMLKERRQVYLDQSPRPVLEVVNNGHNDKLVILGDPGSGKSTLLKAVALEWARLENAAERQQRTLPLLIELGPYDRWECPHGKSFVRYLQDAQTVHRLDQFRLDERLRQAGGAVLLLDGLDEIFDPNRRKDALNDIHRFSNEYPATRIIVTSRVIGYDQRQLADAGFRHFMLQDLDEAQIHEFLDHWYTTFVSDARERFEKQDRLRRAVAESRPIRELAENPLLLTMMAILNLHQELPRDRVRLYERATEVLLHHWDFERLGLKGAVEYREKAELLRRLADHMQSAHGGLKGNIIDGEELQRIFREYLKNELDLPNAYQVANELVAQLRERNFILCHLGADKYAFVHRTLLEYFCATAIVQKFRQRLSLDYLKHEIFGHYWHDETWREVLCLIAGIISDSSISQVGAILEFLLDRDSQTSVSQPSFVVADCLLAIRNTSSLTELKNRLVQKLYESLPNDDVGYVFTFSPEDFEYTDEITEDVVPLLANTSINNDPTDLLKELSIHHENSIVRICAIQELARGWRNDDTLSFLRSIATSKSYSHISREDDVNNEDEGEEIDEDECHPYTPDRVLQAAIHEIVVGWEKTTEVVLWLKERAYCDDHDSREGSLWDLANFWRDDPDTLEIIKDRLIDDEDESVRHTALTLLAKHWKDNELVFDLVKQCTFDDEANWVSKEAFQSLGKNWKEHPSLLPWLKNLAEQKANEWASDLALIEIKRGWKDDPKVQNWLKQIEPKELQPLVTK